MVHDNWIPVAKTSVFLDADVRILCEWFPSFLSACGSTCRRFMVWSTIETFARDKKSCDNGKDNP